MDLVLRRARIEDREGLFDIGLAGGRIAEVAPRIAAECEAEIDVDGRLVSPTFVDPHIHLDKVGVLPMLPTNRSGTLAEAIELLHQSKRAATVEEIAERAGRIIRQAVMAGTTALRSHVDIDTIGGLRPLEGVVRAREEHADICDIQIVAFPQEGIERDPGTDELMRQAMKSGADAVGGMPHWEADREASRRHVEFCLDLAVEHDADVDMHVDETDDPAYRSLEMVADAAEARGWGGRTNAGHCCAMAAWEDDYTEFVIGRLREAGVSVITNPATNLMLQGRGDTRLRRRGTARVKELLEAGVLVGCGQDCVEDAFYPFGMADQLQVALILVHAAQLSAPAEIERAMQMVRGDAATIMHLSDYGLHAGARGDLVVLDAETPADALRTQAPRRWVVRAGRVVAETRTETELRRA
jgi:cytosine/creatinine deaminase